ncbi:hypothetical protein HPP92_008550 [Vanilla planifolia]|uniref:Uncharacterized protein n=1 Tax=Vanilla planifolia TaxID=51239 RepID=A0A835R6J8_VANPL|nr:hypothetical protein HPP92_008550 [Vanilla planifolia]
MRTESLNREGSTCVRPRDVRTIGGSSTGVFGNGDDDGGGAARRTSESNSLGKKDTSVHQVDSTAAKLRSPPQNLRRSSKGRKGNPNTAPRSPKSSRGNNFAVVLSDGFRPATLQARHLPP